MPEHATLVTGGASGIGLAIARSRGLQGERVIIVDRQPPPQDLDCLYLKVDLADADAIGRAIDGIDPALAVTRVINCAGLAITAPIERFSAADFDLTMSVNVRAAALVVKGVLPAMKAAGFGRIVNIASRAALGRALRTAYAASKGGLISATRVWALELAAHGITVNAIGPGPIQTELYRSANPPESEDTKRIATSVPVKRLGIPEDVALAADYFLDARAGFVTGQVLYVCGGLSVGGVAV